MTWIDRAIRTISPGWQVKRLRARLAVELLERHYEAAATGRRTSGWNRPASDANTANAGASLQRLRDAARDLTRNSGEMGQALRTIANHTVGWGIRAGAKKAPSEALAAWKAWAESPACDADGREDLYGLQKLVMRGVAESGEMLIRRRIRRIEDGLPIPLQLQVLEPDFLDTARTMTLQNGGRIIQGVEFDPLGRRAAYWLFPEHSGSSTMGLSTLITGARRIPASEILHVFQRERAGQVRAASWFAGVLVTAKDLDEYGDAQLMKQKIAACLAVIVNDIDGAGIPLGTVDPNGSSSTTGGPIDSLEPGAILNGPPGRNVTVVQPPKVDDFGPFTTVNQRKIAKGLGLSYEDYSGDYSNVNFSSARMARLEHYENVYDWRWRVLIPQFCAPAWTWAMQALQLLGTVDTVPAVNWTAPAIPMIEPDKEGIAYARNIRTGIQSLPEAIRERGYDPDELLSEIADSNRRLDDLGIVLDSDPRRMTQAGQAQSASTGSSAAPAAASGEYAAAAGLPVRPVVN